MRQWFEVDILSRIEFMLSAIETLGINITDDRSRAFQKLVSLLNLSVNCGVFLLILNSFNKALQLSFESLQSLIKAIILSNAIHSVLNLNYFSLNILINFN